MTNLTLFKKKVPNNQNRDNFIDKAFTVIAESIVKIMPIADKEKKAYIYYRDGLAAQNNGDYSEALDYYNESLLLEENKIDRGETLKNMAIIYMSNGCLLYTSPSPRDQRGSRMPSSA